MGSLWLKNHFNLKHTTLTHSSYIGKKESIELTAKGNVEQVYGPKYQVEKDDPLHHLEFSLKYDDFNLDFLKTVLEKISNEALETFIASAPSSKYGRKIGFLFEFLTGQQINSAITIGGNYVDLLDDTKYVTGRTIKESRWRINNNLLGTSAYCPVVRKTKQLTDLLSQNTQEKILALKKNFASDVFKRAVNYLYNKETKSSYEIEREEPSPDRVEKFVRLLMEAGKEVPEEILSKARLIQLQNTIVDPRFAAVDFRDFQNFVGESLPNFQEQIHYICPPPEILPSLMAGLRDVLLKTTGIYPEVRSALASFGFVFIHPFEDGNGRLHRFLIHDLLVSDNSVPGGIIVPISAHMINHMQAYDQTLEKYSKPLMQRISYERLDDGGVAVTNLSSVEGYFRYPDLTEQCVYLMQTIHQTITEDMPDEIMFIQRYDEAKRAIQRIVDMPDKLVNMMLIFLHQNKGVFPKRRRDYFFKLTDEEIARMQTAYQNVFDEEANK
jgi:hypothetical protein